MTRWVAHEGFAGCVTSAQHAAAVFGGRAETAPRGGEGLIVLSSWHPSYEPLLESGATVVPRWHSPLLQTELSEEGWKLARQLELLEAGRVPAVAVNDRALADALGRERVVWLPDVLDVAVAVRTARAPGAPACRCP